MYTADSGSFLPFIKQGWNMHHTLWVKWWSAVSCRNVILTGVTFLQLTLLYSAVKIWTQQIRSHDLSDDGKLASFRNFVLSVKETTESVK